MKLTKLLRSRQGHTWSVNSSEEAILSLLALLLTEPHRCLNIPGDTIGEGGSSVGTGRQRHQETLSDGITITTTLVNFLLATLQILLCTRQEN